MSRNSKNTRNRAHAVQFQMGATGPAQTVPLHGKRNRVAYVPSKVAARLSDLRLEKQGSRTQTYSI